MKNIFYFALTVMLAFSVTSCDSFLDLDNYQEIPGGKAYESPQDVTNGLIGMYYNLGTYRFYGRDLVAVGDMAADISVASASSGHFVEINRYTMSETNEELEDIWLYGYKIVDGSLRVIGGAKKLIENGLSETDEADMISAISQSYSLRALTYFKLVNIFGLPYQANVENSQLGIPVLSKIVKPFEPVDRATVEATYKQILDDIDSAKVYIEKLDPDYSAEINQFYFNEAAIYALESRVNLYMGEYDKAITAAETAIVLRASSDVSNEMYVKMWASNAISDEDIFTISKSESDNLSSNSLNTLYNSYKGTLRASVRNSFSDSDIRKALITSSNRPKKFDGLPSSEATTNVPVFRKSEMYLIIAESHAQKDRIADAQAALFYTAKRNTSITAETELPDSKDALLIFIAQEKVREFFQEGHRWYDVRRTNEKINVNVAGSQIFDIAKFVYPIPADEINAKGGVSVQNPNWADALPKKAE